MRKLWWFVRLNFDQIYRWLSGAVEITGGKVRGFNATVKREWVKYQEAYHEIKIPKRDVTYIVLSVYLVTLTSLIRHKIDHNLVNLI